MKSDKPTEQEAIREALEARNAELEALVPALEAKLAAATKRCTELETKQGLWTP